MTHEEAKRIAEDMENGLRMALDERGIPAHCVPAIVGYVLHGVETGGFLRAVFQNKLAEAVGRADGKNIEAIVKFAEMLHNDVPRYCWGSEESVREWMANKGALGFLGFAVTTDVEPIDDDEAAPGTCTIVL